MTETAAPEGYQIVAPMNVTLTPGRTEYLTVTDDVEHGFTIKNGGNAGEQLPIRVHIKGGVGEGNAGLLVHLNDGQASTSTPTTPLPRTIPC